MKSSVGLGRNYIETGRYLEKIFPFLGVRFIAVTDHYDSAAESDDADQIIVPFKNLINDAYCRDISIKIRSQLDVKRKNGQFIGSFAGYWRSRWKSMNFLIGQITKRRTCSMNSGGIGMAGSLTSTSLPPRV